MPNLSSGRSLSRAVLLHCLTWLMACGAAHAASPQAVTLAPHATELLFAAGAGKQIRATVHSSDHPAKARQIPRIGDGVHINTETLVAMRPDIVIAWQPTEAVRALRPALDAAGIQLLYSRPQSLDEIPMEIRRFGDLFHTTSANEAAANLQERINTLRGRYAHRSLVRVYIDLGSDPLYTLGNDPLLNNVLSICRGVNIYADASVAAPLVSLESLLARQPDAIILASSSAAHAAHRKQYWKTVQLKAALSGHAFSANPDLLFRPGPRLVDAAETLCGDLDKVRKSR